MKNIILNNIWNMSFCNANRLALSSINELIIFCMHDSKFWCMTGKNSSDNNNKACEALCCKLCNIICCSFSSE